MRILGLSAFGGEAAAALLVDGQLIAACSEERFTRNKRDQAFPRRAVRSCLRAGGITAAELDWVVFYEKPLKKFERVLASQMRGFPSSAGTFARSMFTWLGDRLWLKTRIASELGVSTDKVLFTQHHEAHAASAYLPSPFDEAAVLVADGAGEWATTSLHRGEGGALQSLEEVHFPNSLGLFYSALAEFLGFQPGGGEGRVVELSGHGEPKHVEELSRLLTLEADGSFEVDMSCFRFGYDGERLCSPVLAERLGAPRDPGAPLELSGRDADLAASVQAVTEEALLGLVRALHGKAPSRNLCLAGELALNPRAVARLLTDGPFDRIYVQPAAGDAGGALGAALAVHGQLGGERNGRPEHAFLGEDVVVEPGKDARPLGDEDAIVDALLLELLEHGMAGWVRGRFEWGPRSLGHRSLLADPRRAEIKQTINRGVKRREDFRPYSPAVPAGVAGKWFELPSGAEQPLRYMQMTVKAHEHTAEQAPAIVHVDGTARPQAVDPAIDPLFHRLLERFGEATGVPLLLHTSLNLRGDPPVRGEEDALALFERSELPALVVEDRLYKRG